MTTKYLHEVDVSPGRRFPSEQPRCTYCDSPEHSIQRCDVYEFHNDMGSDVSEEWTRGRDLVLARRKCKYYGGIPEMYLKKPSPEQARIAERYRLEQKDKFIADAKRISEEMRKPQHARDMERGYSDWSPAISRMKNYFKACRERDDRWAKEKE